MRLANSRFLGFVVGFYVLLVSITLFQKTGRCDLGFVLTAAQRLASGESMYRVDWDHQEHTKPPLGTMPFVPLTGPPRENIERVWDVFILGAFFFLCFFWSRHAMASWNVPPWKLGVLSLAVTFNCWNSELRCGQFNALALLAVIGSVTGPAVARGPLLAWALWIKPTNAIFLPWVWRYTPSKWALALGVGAYTAVLSAIYGLSFGWDRLLGDHREWMGAAPLSVAKHIHRYDNVGLPSALSWFTKDPRVSTLIQALGIGLAAWIVVTVKDRWRALSLVAIATAALSPMGWIQNYVLMTPFVFLLWNDYFGETEPVTKRFLGLALLSLFLGFEVYNPTLQKTIIGGPIIIYRPPFVSLVVAMVLVALAKARDRSAPSLAHGYT